VEGIEGQDAKVRDDLLEYAEKLSMPHSVGKTGRSDHAPLAESGVQAVTLIEMEMSSYHSPNDNALNVDLSGYDKVVSNLPYNILEPFIKECVKYKVQHLIIIIGARYAYSMFRENIEKEVSYLSLITKCFFHCNIFDFISKEAFDPAPRTESAIMEFKYFDKIQLVSKEELYIFRELFEQQDKKIKNALMEGLIRFHDARGYKITKNMAKVIINRLNIDNNILEGYLNKMSNEDINKLYFILKYNSLFIEK
jgi:16S rRNA A1518/A1519 N6-dimethyltransferase RsmA/KsgA/DIM1 with predicted DNA glycosylase/AP lyase activity